MLEFDFILFDFLLTELLLHYCYAFLNNVLGESNLKAKGKVTRIRVLDVEGGIPNIETTISQNGNMRRTEITIMVSYCHIPRPTAEGIGDGQTIFYADGVGVLMTKDGTEMATWTGHGYSTFFW